MSNVIHKEFSVVKEGDVVIVSSEGRDRMGDTIKQDGWLLDSFVRNPQMFYGHNTSAFPVGNWKNVRYVDGKLAMEPVFADEIPAHTDAQIVKGLWDRGFLRTVSVGFVPIESNPSETGTDYLKQELLEVSIVPIPANTDAHRLAMKALLESTQKEAEPAPPPAVDTIDELKERVQRLEAELAALQCANEGMPGPGGPSEGGETQEATQEADESITLIIGDE